MLDRPFITLTTDYGLNDPFVGIMKGVILHNNPLARIIDITHNVERHNIYNASQIIGMSYKYFPPTTIHVAVVDPSVGGERRPILVITENHYFIGPDNGIFSLIFEKENNSFLKVIHLTSSHYFLAKMSSTFHGRDIFAPVAAWLSKGVDSHNFGEEITDPVRIPLPKLTFSDNSIMHGEVVSFDHFGNAITNITFEDLSGLAASDVKLNIKIIYKERDVPYLTFYAEAEGQTLSATINGYGRLELFVNRDSALKIHNINIGDRVSVMPSN